MLNMTKVSNNQSKNISGAGVKWASQDLPAVKAGGIQSAESRYAEINQPLGLVGGSAVDLCSYCPHTTPTWRQTDIVLARQILSIVSFSPPNKPRSTVYGPFYDPIVTESFN